MENTITSMGNMRTFAVAVPKNLQPTEVLPVIFLWYWLKGTEGDFYSKGDIQNAATSTNMAVNGNGYFIVEKPSSFAGKSPTSVRFNPPASHVTIVSPPISA